MSAVITGLADSTYRLLGEPGVAGGWMPFLATRTPWDPEHWTLAHRNPVRALRERLTTSSGVVEAFVIYDGGSRATRRNRSPFLIAYE